MGDMDNKDKIASMTKKKTKGNAYFKMRRYDKACIFYDKAIKQFGENDMKKLDDDEKKQITDCQIACHSNTAMCKLKMKEFAECIENCDKALKLEANHVKSLFRRGQAHAYNGDNNKALKDLKAAKKLQPKDKAIIRMCGIVRRRVQQRKKKEKSLYAGMFDKMTLAKGKNAGYAEGEGDGSSSSDSSSSSDDESDSDYDEAPTETKKKKKKDSKKVDSKEDSKVSKEEKADSKADSKEDKADSKEDKADSKE